MLIKRGVIAEENVGIIKRSDAQIVGIIEDQDHELNDEDTRKELERVAKTLKHSNKTE